MRTVRVTAMIPTIVACGQMFAAVFVGSGGLETPAGLPEGGSASADGVCFLLVMFDRVPCRLRCSSRW